MPTDAKPVVILLQNKLLGSGVRCGAADGDGAGAGAGTDRSPGGVTHFSTLCNEYNKARTLVEDSARCVFALFSTQIGKEFSTAMKKRESAMLTAGRYVCTSGKDATICSPKDTYGAKSSKTELVVQPNDIVLLLDEAATESFHGIADVQALRQRKKPVSLLPKDVLGVLWEG